MPFIVSADCAKTLPLATGLVRTILADTSCPREVVWLL